jgi:hypothetical protein
LCSRAKSGPGKQIDNCHQNFGAIQSTRHVGSGSIWDPGKPATGPAISANAPKAEVKSGYGICRHSLLRVDGGARHVIQAPKLEPRRAAARKINVTRECEFCGVVFTLRRPSDDNRFCSARCSARARYQCEAA